MTTDVALVFDFHTGSLSRQARWSEDSLVTDGYRYDDDTEFEVFTKSLLVPGTTPTTIVGSRYLVPDQVQHHRYRALIMHRHHKQMIHLHTMISQILAMRNILTG